MKELVNTHVPLSGARHACIWFLEILDGCEGARGTLAFGHLGTHTEHTLALIQNIPPTPPNACVPRAPSHT